MQNKKIKNSLPTFFVSMATVAIFVKKNFNFFASINCTLYNNHSYEVSSKSAGQLMRKIKIKFLIGYSVSMATAAILKI